MSELLSRAARNARKQYPKSTAFQSAYMKGVRAKLNGLQESDCPYSPDPKKTWRRAYRAAWLRGFQSMPRL